MQAARGAIVASAGAVMLAAGWMAAPGPAVETVAEPEDGTSTEPSATPTATEDDCITEMAIARPAPLSDDDDDDEFEDEVEDEADDDLDDDDDDDDGVGTGTPDSGTTDPATTPSTDCVTPVPDAGGETGGSATEGSQTFTGAAVQNLRGFFQVEIVVVDGVVADVVVLQAGTDDEESIERNQAALPILIPAMVDQQTWDVDYVSGSSYTSEGITASAQDAFAQAGLG